MQTSVYNAELLWTITDCNNHNDATLYNENIRDEIHRLVIEKELNSCHITWDANNVTANTFSQMYNTQRENASVILKSEKLYKSYALEKR